MTESPAFRFDRAREARIGFGEAVFCESKSADQIAAILHEVGDDTPILLTRLEAQKADALPRALRDRLDFDALSRTAYLRVRCPLHETARVAVLSAGTSDLPVAQEAVRTLGFHGEPSQTHHDVGVAGLWRLEACLDDIRAMPVVIVTAGMEGALVSVVAGLVPGVVIALPTSVGYGAAEGGRTAMFSALTSCAPGIAVVNIDNGYGAACAALRHLNMLDRGQG